MDVDLELARQLQAEEQVSALAIQAVKEAVRAGPSQPRYPKDHPEASFFMRLQSGVSTAQKYEDPLLQAVALSLLPLDELTTAAAEAAAVSVETGEDKPLAEQDALASQLLSWFKGSFFQWVDKPACQHCGSGSTAAKGAVRPSPDEAEGMAGRTELYRCGDCGQDTRFPRYNDPGKLLETRRGRCGEWANCFALCCRAAGLDTRWVLDFTDHVWVEYWSDAEARWVHMDPCEGVRDQPLLYEAGWGKKLMYVIGFSRQDVTDVTRRYTRAPAELAARRNMVSEQYVRDATAMLTGQLRASLHPDVQAVLEDRRAREQDELAACHGSAPTDADLAMPGRQTGSAEWKAARGEDGSAAAAATCTVPLGQPATRFQRACNGHVGDGRIAGGFVRASGEHPPDETAGKACDGEKGTKWLDFGGGGGRGPTWLEWMPESRASALGGGPAQEGESEQEGKPSPPLVTVSRYAITSANDSPERDPCSFILQGLPEGGETWQNLDSETDIVFPSRHATLSFTVAKPAPCRRYRLMILAVRDPRAANSVQVAEFVLYPLQQTNLPRKFGPPVKH